MQRDITRCAPLQMARRHSFASRLGSYAKSRPFRPEAGLPHKPSACRSRAPRRITQTNPACRSRAPRRTMAQMITPRLKLNHLRLGARSMKCGNTIFRPEAGSPRKIPVFSPRGGISTKIPAFSPRGGAPTQTSACRSRAPRRIMANHGESWRTMACRAQTSSR